MLMHEVTRSVCQKFSVVTSTLKLLAEKSVRNMSEHKQRRLTKFEKAPVDSVNSEYMHEIYLSNGYIRVGYSEKELNPPEPPPFAPFTWKNLNNYVIRMILGPKSPYYPGHHRGVMQVIFYDNKTGDQILKVRRGSVEWGSQYLLNENWKDVVFRIEKVVEFAGSLPPYPDANDLQAVKRKYSFSKRAEGLKFDSKDLSAKWATLQSLTNYCRMLRDAQYPEGEILHYYHQYKAKYFTQ